MAGGAQQIRWRGRSLGRGALPLVLLALLPLGSGALAQEAGSGLTLRVEGLGLTGPLGRPRRFVTLRARVENQGQADVEATLAAYRSRPGRDLVPAQGLFYERRLSLPAGGRRNVLVYFYCQENEPAGQLCVALRPQDGGEPLTVTPALRVGVEAIPILFLSSQQPDAVEAVANAFRGLRVPDARQVWPTEVDMVDPRELTGLPDHPVGYDPYEAVVVCDLAPDALSEVQQRALLDWVAGGGSLIVVSSGRGGDIEGSPFREQLPIQRPLGGSLDGQASLGALGPLAPSAPPPGTEPVRVERVVPREGAWLLGGSVDEPLLVRGGCGAGYVTWLSFPVDAAPLRGWRGRGEMLSALLRPPGSHPGGPESPAVAPPLEELLLNLSEAVQALTPPSALLVAPLLLLYVVLVSPVNYRVLAARRRLPLAQLSAALIGLVFTGVFLALGSAFKGSEALVTQVALIDLARDGGLSRIDQLTGYFSTDRGLVEVEGPSGAMVGPIAEVDLSREARVMEGADRCRLEAVAIDTWALRRFRSVRAADLGGIQARLTLEGGILRGEITNRSKLPLTRPLLLLPQGWLELPDLAAQASCAVGTAPMPLEAGYRDAERMNLVRALMDDARHNYPPLYGAGFMATLGAAYEGSPQRRMLASLFARLGAVPRVPGHLPALLVARSETAPEGCRIDRGGAEVLTRSIVTCELQVPESGALSLTGVPYRVVAGRGWTPALTGPGSAPSLSAGDEPGYVDVIWSLPASPERPLSVSQLRLRWSFDPQPKPEQTAIRMWSFRRQGWIELPDPGQERYEVLEKRVWPTPDVPLDPAELVDPASGQVRARVMVAAGLDVQLPVLVLDVRGER